MIDNDLIETSILYASKVTPKEIIPGLYKIENFLFPPLLKRLLLFVSTNELEWIYETNTNGKDLIQPRKKINWLPDSPIEEVHKVLENYTPFINKLLDRNNTFNGITIWKDTSGYQIKPHTDNPIFDVALQLYLSDNPNIKKATTFYLNYDVYTLDHVPNTGYIIDNRKKILHSFTENIPENDIRFSLHSVWFKKS
jgi:hypothetical protein